MKLAQEEIIKGRYRIERELYEGGMGVVYLCTDTVTGKKGVIKHPLFTGRNDDIRIEKLGIEGKILKLLSHPYIVRYIDSFEENDVIYLVIEYINGKDLKTLFDSNPAPESYVRNYCEQLLDALEYLHNQNIIHRDIKPHNIMVCDNTVKLIDFGGAKMRFTSIGQKPTFLWTPGYSAPEQHAGECYFQSDIYAVGATMYFLLTGKDPCKIPPLSPRDENPDVNSELDTVVAKATDIDPNNRFQTATEMKDEIFGIYRPRLPYNPRLIVGSKEFEVAEDSLTIGRGGPTVHPDIVIDDPDKYLSKIHARIVKDSQNKFWVEDCSLNGTFVFAEGGYRRIRKWELSDNDIIAFCWNPAKGPYILSKFRTY